MSWILRASALAGVLALTACGVMPRHSQSASDEGVDAPLFEGRAAYAGWHHHAFPGKRATRFRSANDQGREIVEAQSDASASMLKQVVHIEPAELSQLRFSWKVPQLIADADMALRENDDSPVRVVLAFEGDRSKFSVKDAMLSELALALTGEPMPYATLMYVWCNQRAPGTVIVNPRTSRIRKIVIESGKSNLARWLHYERDIRADYMAAFGEDPGALIGVGIMTDSDNTRSKTKAWYGPVELNPASIAAR